MCANSRTMDRSGKRAPAARGRPRRTIRPAHKRVFQSRRSLAATGGVMKLRAVHVTRYLYAEDVSTCHTEVRLSPRIRAGQAPLGHHLDITPKPDFSASREDYFGNGVVSFSIDQPHRELVI